jgi:hypothetical protein
MAHFYILQENQQLLLEKSIDNTISIRVMTLMECPLVEAKALKTSRELIFGLFCCCIAFQRHYGMWSLTSPRVERVSGSKNFHSSSQKEFAIIST